MCRKHTWITVDFHDEENYHNQLNKSKDFIAAVTEFILSVGLKLCHKPNCPGGCKLTRHSHYGRIRLDGLEIWRVQCTLCKAVFTVMPNFVLPYRATPPAQAKSALHNYYRGLSLDCATEELEQLTPSALFRLWCSFGQSNTVEVLLKAQLSLPEYLEFDEKHSSCEGEPVYLPTVSSGDVIWSLAFCEHKTPDDFIKGYGVFQQAALECQPAWQAKGILCDDYDSTTQAAHALQPNTPVGICIRHSSDSLKRQLAGVEESQLKQLQHDFWHLFEKRGIGLIPVFCLGQRLRHFVGKAKKLAGEVFGKKIHDWIQRKKAGWFAVMRDANMPLTSAKLDQLHNFIDRKLFAMKGFHHASIDRQAFLNTFVLVHDFMPYMHRSKHPGQCPIEVAGGKMPASDWFLSMRILTSGGFS